MQADHSLPMELKRNYKNVIDGIFKISKN